MGCEAIHAIKTEHVGRRGMGLWEWEEIVPWVLIMLNLRWLQGTGNLIPDSGEINIWKSLAFSGSWKK